MSDIPLKDDKVLKASLCIVLPFTSEEDRSVCFCGLHLIFNLASPLKLGDKYFRNRIHICAGVRLLKLFSWRFIPSGGFTSNQNAVGKRIVFRRCSQDTRSASFQPIVPLVLLPFTFSSANVGPKQMNYSGG